MKEYIYRTYKINIILVLGFHYLTEWGALVSYEASSPLEYTLVPTYLTLYFLSMIFQQAYKGESINNLLTYNISREDLLRSVYSNYLFLMPVFLLPSFVGAIYLKDLSFLLLKIAFTFSFLPYFIASYYESKYDLGFLPIYGAYRLFNNWLPLLILVSFFSLIVMRNIRRRFLKGNLI